MRTLFITLALVGFGCGDDGGSTTVDAAPPIDSPAPVAPTCADYCTKITANCVTPNAQYPTEAQCLATCATFAVGTSKVTDTQGNTLGCRIYHTDAAKAAPATHCPHAGPGGDVIGATAEYCTVESGSTGVCDSFCNIEIATCGSIDQPRSLTGGMITPRYQNLAACKTACATFDTTMPFSTTASGDTLACRLYHVTNAALFASQDNLTSTNAHCGHTADPAVAICL